MDCKNCNGGASGHYQTRAASVEQVTLTYNANGGENPPAAVTVDKGTDVVVKNQGSMTRTGYKFLGWSASSSGEADWMPGDSMNVTVNTTLYAVWEKEEPTPTPTPTESDYTVSWYDADNGEEIKAPETRSGEVGKEVAVTDADKVVPGYTFDEDNDGNVLRAVLENASSTELKLYFTKNPDNKITVTWMDGYTSTPIKVGTIDPDPDTNSDVFKGMYPADPTREGWKFTKWGEPKTDDDGNITITAQWQEDVTDPGPDDPKTPDVTYKPTPDPENPDEPTTPKKEEVQPGVTIIVDPNTGNWTNPDNWPEQGGKFSHVVEEGDSITIVDPTKPGNEFIGWARTEETDGAGNITITLTAQWKDKQPAEPTPTPTSQPTPPPVNPNPPTPPTPTTTYTVNWEDGDGNIIKTTTTTSTTVPDSLYPADPEREGESFTGWGEPEISGTVITIIAQWDEEIDEPDVPLIVAPGLDAVNHFAYIIGYGDGTVRPGRNITRAEVATIFYRLMTDDYRGTYWSQTNTFTDVNSGDWFNNAVSTSAEAELVKGYADGTFKGKNNITRAEFATIAARFLSDEPTGENPFTDIQGHWAETDILKAYEAGWINGYADGSFRPNAKITRAEAMTIVNRMLNRVPHAEDLHEDMVTYPDNQPDAWYYAAVQEATNSHDYDMGDRDGETVETWTAMKANRNWAALEKEWSNAYSGSNGNDVM